jgi:tetraacyldisaccharide 4'-kinase
VNTLRKYLLFPIGILYGCISSFRIWLYTSGILKQYHPQIATITVGNLSVGGTGKTPHTIYLATFLSKKFNVGILSRGYGRASKGYIEVKSNSSSIFVGDEPLLMKQLLGAEIPICVCESRKEGLERMQHEFPNLDVILMDDAFQHVQVKSGFSIVLNDFSEPYFIDWPLPAGNLRELRFGIHRADCCIFTKCSVNIDAATKTQLSKRFSTVKPTYFSNLVNGAWLPLNNHQVPAVSQFILVSGIANPKPMKEYLELFGTVHSVLFPDHHQFSAKDLNGIHELFGNFAGESTIIITTAKDAVRLQESQLSDLMKPFPWFVLPLEVKLDESNKFEHEIIKYVEQNKRSSSLHTVKNDNLS